VTENDHGGSTGDRGSVSAGDGSDDAEAADPTGPDGTRDDGVTDAGRGDDPASPDAAEAAFYDALEAVGGPVVTARRYGEARGLSQEEAAAELARLADEGVAARQEVSADPVVWYPVELDRLTDRERVIPFPDRHELIVDQPTQLTRAQCTQFARLEDTTGSGAYRYVIRREDVWAAPYEEFEDLQSTLRDVLPEARPGLEEWMAEQWSRANQFTLATHEEGYVILAAETPELMGNVARDRLDDGQLRATIDDTTSWVAEEAVAEVKRILFEAGYPVRDERDLKTGDHLPVDLHLELRDYQREWVSRFLETRSGVLVGPPGSGKTVATLGVLAEVEGETLILVPGRELVTQWRDEILAHTSLGPDQVGEYHGGAKEIRPVTIATYQSAGMDRHRQLFDSREWGLIVYDEVHHVPAPVHRRSADLQTKHRLGLSSTPVREDERETEIFTLVGPPIGTDWDALFEAGYVAEPTVEIRYVPWSDEGAQNEYVSAQGHERRQLAATNPAKRAEARELLRHHPEEKALVFVDYLDQGRELAADLDVPFVSGETPHHRREKLFEEFRTGSRETLLVSRVGDEGIDLPSAELAIVASGLGGSRRQGAQRAGRTMRPTGRARMVVLATRGTREEDFARRRVRHLLEKGVRVQERDAETVPAEPGDAE
jgi:DNA excision repair protein ERCC-3